MTLVVKHNCVDKYLETCLGPNQRIYTFVLELHPMYAKKRPESPFVPNNEICLFALDKQLHCPEYGIHT
jgi:hypothetical protein